MSITCDMAMDLIALYKDGLASEDSRKAIEEHLRSCPECTRAYASYSTEPPKRAPRPNPVCADRALETRYIALARSLRRNRMIQTVTTLAIVTASLALGSYGMLHLLDRRHPDNE